MNKTRQPELFAGLPKAELGRCRKCKKQFAVPEYVCNSAARGTRSSNGSAPGRRVRTFEASTQTDATYQEMGTQTEAEFQEAEIQPEISPVISHFTCRAKSEMARPTSGSAARATSPMATPAVSRSRKVGDGTSQPSSAWHDVLELCKKGFANKLESLCDVLVTAVRNEMRQGAEKWRGEVMDQMSQREHQLDKSLLSLREKLDHMELKIMDPDRVDSPFRGPLPPTSPGTPVVAERPLPPGSPTHAPASTPSQTLRTGSVQRMQVDELMPVMEHLRKSDTLHQAASAQLEEHLERVRERCEALGRVSTAVLNGVQRLEQQVQQLEHKSQVAEAKMSNVLGQQQSLNAVSSQVAKELQSLQQKDALAFSDLQGRLQSHATEMRSVVHDDVHGLQEDLSGIKEHQQKDFRTVVTEISRIQQVLHLDFVKVLHEEPCRKMISRARQAPRTSGNDLGGLQASKRFRDFFAQTEPPPQKEAHSQTEASLYLEVDFKPRTRRESKHSNQPMLEEAASQHFGGGEEHFKEKAREAAMKPPYSVFDFYYSTGCSQAIARSPYFEYVTLWIVFLNAGWMAVDMDLNTATVITDAHPAFLIVENAFCTYFFLELLIRFAAFERKCNCFRDGWFVLDLLLVVLYVLDTWLVLILVYGGGIRFEPGGGSMMTILRMLRMAKLCRLTRLARLLRAVPELVIIVKGIGFASRSVTIFFIFWTLITYAFAIAIRELTENTEVGKLYFRTVPEAMNTLLLQGLFPENQYLLIFDNPLRALCQGLTDFALQLGPAAAELVGSMAQGDVTWAWGEDAPNGQQLQENLNALRNSMALMGDAMLSWRLGLAEDEGVRFDRIQFGVVVAADELLYHDGYQVIQVIRDTLSGFQVIMQAALADRASRRSDDPPLETSQ
eukprot:s920_g3.t1